MRFSPLKKGRIAFCCSTGSTLASEVADRRTFLQPVCVDKMKELEKPGQVDFFPRSQETVAKWTTGREAERLYSVAPEERRA